jgi:hypothetical protein
VNSLRCTFGKHEWQELRDGYRTCSACCRIERMVGNDWEKVHGVTASNWHIFARRIILDGCDSLAEHRAKLGI